MNDLKPCPFCGCEEVVERQIPGTFEGYRLKQIYCFGCGSTAKSKDIWNGRAGSKLVVKNTTSQNANHAVDSD